MNFKASNGWTVNGAGTGNGSIGVSFGTHLVEVWNGTTSAGNWYDPENIPFDELRPMPRTKAGI